VQVSGRNLALPIDAYPDLTGFGAVSKVYADVGLDVAAEAVLEALRGAGLTPEDVDVLYFTTVTGVGVPSLDARLIGRIGMRPDVRRVPMFGLGCVGGAAGLARLREAMTAHPKGVGLLLSVELCSLTLQREDLSIANLISSGLFGDGAACVVVAGAEHPLAREEGGPWVLDSASQLYPDSEDVMGWDVTDNGFRVVLSADVPKVVREHLAGDVDGFLATHKLERSDIACWVCHPGGPAVMTAFEDALALPDGALEITRRSLRDHGNMSSASVLWVLRDTMQEASPPPGSYGLLLAMGPGFCSELVLLRWRE
jgi:alkylresorcinol/alkylpyrone synthase